MGNLCKNGLKRAGNDGEKGQKTDFKFVKTGGGF
jgi:hypothetical protein